MQNKMISSFTSIFQRLKVSKGVYFLSPILAGYFYAWGFPDQNGSSFAAGTLLSLLFFFIHDSNFSPLQLKKDFFRWAIFFLSANFFGYQWLGYTLREFGQLPDLASELVRLSFSLIIFPQYYPYLLLKKLADWCASTSLQPRYKRLLTNNKALNTLQLALFFTWCEQIVPQQFPAHVGHAWLASAPYLGLAPWLGAVSFSFFTYLLAFSLIEWWREKRPPIFQLCACLLFLACNLALPLPAEKKQSETLKVRLVQANIGNMLKLQAERGYRSAIDAVLSGYESLSLAAPHPDLVIWPETSYPQFFQSREAYEVSVAHPRLAHFLSELQTPLLLGGYFEVPIADVARPWESFEDVYNSAILIGVDAHIEQIYNKRKLIPFGETLPFPKALNLILAQHLPAVSFFARGDRASQFTFKENFHAIALICYEVLFSSLVREQLNELNLAPDFLINLTNDSWYGPTSELHQHKFLAHWRALEIQAPILRSTNTGITSVLYPDGSESRQLKWDEISFLDVEIPKRAQVGPTFYQRFGDWPLWAIATALIFLQFLLSRKTPPSNASTAK